VSKRRSNAASSPVTVTACLVVCAGVAALREPLFSQLIRDLFGPMNYFAALGNAGGASHVAVRLSLIFAACVLAYLCAGLLMSFVDGHLPLDEAERVPPLRGVDVATNRRVGVFFVLWATGLVVAPGGSPVFGELFALFGIVAGALLIHRPQEAREGYSIRAHADWEDDKSNRDWEQDPAFRVWAERLKRRMHEKRQREQQEQHRRQYYGHRSSGSRRPERVVTVGDPWSVLGVEPGSSLREITTAWRRLCKRYHPDLVPIGLKEVTEDALKKVNEAYRLLKKRARSQTD